VLPLSFKEQTSLLLHSVKRRASRLDLSVKKEICLLWLSVGERDIAAAAVS
jgi:hypothetical protein